MATGFSTRPDLMHDVQTLTRLGEPLTIARILWMLGFQRRLVRRWEWLTLMPQDGPLPHISQTEAMSKPLRIGNWETLACRSMNGSKSQSVSETLRASQLADTLSQYAEILKDRRKGIDALNVYPVPDGDTGTNMSLTISSVAKELKSAAKDDMSSIATAISRGAVMGARGNSGAILAQALRGVAESVKEKKLLDPHDVAEAFERARKGAYESVLKPVEGTILTVLTAAATAARKSADEGSKLKDQLEHVREASAEALARTPELLPQLKAAGVVDAGGSGFLLLIDALRFVVSGEPIPAAEMGSANLEALSANAGDAIDEAHGEDIGDLRYEVMFLLEDVNDSKIDEFRNKWGNVGDSIVVVGGGGLLNCHIHADEIGPTIEVALDYGRPRDIRVTDLMEQVHGGAASNKNASSKNESDNDVDDDISDDVANAVTSSVVVVSGKGLATLFRSLGASRIVAGGQSMNPSVEEMLDAVNACKTNEVLIVSNNTNVTPAARQVDGLTEKTVRVVATRNPVEGLAAMVAFAPGVDAETNVDSISDAIETVIGGEVTQAVRDAELETQKIKKGDWLALGPGGIAVVAQDVVSASTQWFEKFVNDEHEIATLCLGVDAKGEDTSRIGEWLSENHPDLEVQVHQGGQPLHAYLLGLE